MKQKLLQFTLCSVILVLFSCSEDSPLFPEFTTDYFPTAVGNKWVYNNGTLDWTIEIEATKIIDKKTYYVFVRNYDGARDTNFYRVAENNLVFVWFDDKDYTYINFDAPINQQWQFHSGYYGFVRERNLTDTVTAGSFTDVTEILIANHIISDVFEYNCYAPGVGLISTGGWRRYSELKSATVNGITYP